MTLTQHKPEALPTPEPSKPDPIVSPRQVLIGALAATSAAVVASYFGVAGTVLGTALFSAVATTANALYEHFVRRTSDRLTTLAGTSMRLRMPAQRTPPTPRRLPWGRIVAGATVVFGVAIAGITGFELLVGKPVSALLGRSESRGTSIVRVVEPRHHAPQKAHTTAPTPSTVPSTATPTGSATPSPSPSTTTPSPAPTATAPSPTATPSPSASR